MKIKWNWGTKILIAMILFMVLLLTFVFLTTQQTYHLVEKDYYPKALEYQGKIDKINNAKALDEKVRIEKEGDLVKIKFQSFFNFSKVIGQIVFYRPSDTDSDIAFPIKLDSSGMQLVNSTNMLMGKYIIKIDYEIDGKGYFQEESILIKMY